MKEFSRELGLIIAAINVVVNNGESEGFLRRLLAKGIDWTRLHSLLQFHQLTALFYAACKKVEFTNEVIDKYEVFAKSHAINNINYRNECIRILHLLKERNIKALPYKGVLFLSKLYSDNPIRQMSDIDLVVQEKDAKDALKVLIQDGYNFSLGLVADEVTLDDLIASSPGKEVSLKKTTALGLVAHIDFHWHFNGKTPYYFDLPDFFNQTEEVLWDNKIVDIPTSESILVMLVNHHGARDGWGRLKFLVDMWMYLKAYDIEDVNYILKVTEQFKMRMTTEFAMFALNEVFDCRYKIAQSNYHYSKVINQVVKVWEKADSYKGKIRPKFDIIYLQRKLADEPISWFEIIKRETIYYAGYSPQSGKRIVVLPKKYSFLNALIKVFSEKVFR